ncbi:class I SAM-dependent methyltransferase [Luedemannella flava]
MPDAIFAHPLLARVYDAFDGSRDDLAAYLAIARELGANSVLDIGCGTGSLAILLAGHGYAVVGVDPAEESLKVAGARTGPAGFGGLPATPRRCRGSRPTWRR